MIATTTRHLLRARPSAPSLAARPSLDGPGARRSTSATGEDASASRAAGREAAVRAPFEAYRSSATVRLQRTARTPPSGATSGARAPLPGRLARAPRPAAANVDAATQREVPAAGGGGAGGGPYAPLPREPSARAERRKAAVERRRMLLDKGVTMAKPNPEHGNAVSAQTDTTRAHNDNKAGSARGPRKITIIKEIVRPPSRVQMDDEGNARQTIVPRRSNIPLHSLGDGKLSAADVHRRRLREMREQRRQEEQPRMQEEQNEPHGMTQTQSQDENVPEHRGSMVFARSATSRYREERQKRTQGESSLKANPSSVAIPLSDDAALESDADARSTGGASSGPDFEERYQKLRRRQGGRDESEEKEGGGWSLFGWLRGGR